MIMSQFLSILIFAVICCLQLQYVYCIEGKDNKGKHFIFGFIRNVNAAIQEVFITTDCECTVNVSITTPLFDPNFYKSVSLKRFEVYNVTFNPNIQGGPGTLLNNKGIEIISSEEITVYAVNKAIGASDAYAVFPLDTLGDNYYVITWSKSAEFMIIATEENTTVHIAIADGTNIIYNSVSYITGMTLDITMNKYQTFHVFGGPDYTGNRITSTKPIAVISGALCTTIGFGPCDHLLSQMTPVETFGNTFVTINMPNCNRPVNFKIVASENNTDINITGRVQVSLAKPGNKYLFRITDQSSVIVSSSKPIAIAFFSEGGCGSPSGDPSMILLQPTQQFAADYTFTTIEYPTKPFKDALTIVISESKKDGLRLDGQIILATWRPVDGSDNLRITDFNVTKGAHTIYHLNPIVTFLAVSTGIANANSYGYSSGQRLAPINSNCTPSITVAGDIIDNDCDGLIDEELQDQIDNDGDGEIDEDLAKPFEELNTTTTFTTFMSTTASRNKTTTELPLTTTSRHSTTTPTITSTSNMKEIVGENLSTDMLIAGILSSLFALTCLSTAVYFLQRKLKGKNGQVEDVFQSISSNNIPPVHKTVQNKA